jgi:DnaJ homolog subfamily C member 19
VIIKILLFAAFVALVFYYGRRFLAVPRAPMERDEAAKLLGVAADAVAADINEAHRRLIAKVHPDAGGSKELAARVNQARDVLLKP